jgi:peptidoglycan hydrolase CwlO-like protein
MENVTNTQPIYFLAVVGILMLAFQIVKFIYPIWSKLQGRRISTIEEDSKELFAKIDKLMDKIDALVTQAYEIRNEVNQLKHRVTLLEHKDDDNSEN